MLLLRIFAPSLGWEQGGADIKLSVRGTPKTPVVDGSVNVQRATIAFPQLSRPAQGVSSTIRLQNNTLYVDSLEGRVGRKGSFRAQGALPFQPPALRSRVGDAWAALVSKADTQAGLRVDVKGMEVRAKGAYTGNVDAVLIAKNSLAAPEFSGEIVLSRGTAYLSQGNALGGGPQQPGDAATSASGDARKTALREFQKSATTTVSQVPNLLDALGATRQKLGEVSEGVGRSLLVRPSALPWEEPAAPSDSLIDPTFRGLRVRLGPELRVVYPVVLNFGVSGELELNGKADIERLQPSGSVFLLGGDINLVAMQWQMNRDHPNRVVFVPEHGMDPTVDINLANANTGYEALIQGRTSAVTSRWQDHVKLSFAGADVSDAEAVAFFENQLATSILEKNGQIAVGNLAKSTIESFMPKIETQGSLGKTRWRLVGAPYIPLPPDGSSAYAGAVGSLTGMQMGTTVEVRFGDSATVSAARKPKEGSENVMQTQWALVYHLTKHLRLQIASKSAGSTRATVEFG